MVSPSGYVPIQNSELIHVPGARSVGRVNLSEVAEVTLFTRGPASDPDLESDVRELSKVRATERQHMSAAQFADRYGADPDDLAKIEPFANNNGLSAVAISPASRTVRLTGTLSNFAKAFDVQFSNYQSSQGSYRGYVGPISVPAELASIVKGVFGLDTKPQVRRHLQKLSTSAQAAAKAQSYTPVEVANLYNFPAGVSGHGQCIGILEFGGGFTTSELNVYFQSIGVTTPNIASVSVGGALNAPFPGSNSPDDEVMLDIEVAGAIASGAKIVVYFAPNTTSGYIRAVSTAISDTYDKPKIISTSWGEAEYYSSRRSDTNCWSRAAMEILNYLFQMAAMRGITICAAAGDQGFTDGQPGNTAHVDFPASSPYVLACGGTRLESIGGKISSETVWNDSPSSATGGGVSAVFPVPDYQSNANIKPASVNPPHRTGRGVPDVAGVADPVTGYNIWVDGHWYVIGGTSGVAPLWAALLALINEQLGAPVGFVNALIYSQGETGGGFNDIVNGDNGKGGYSAGPGWDACTGWGSPDGSTLSNLL
jgi:kumamolisin